jgi:flagellar FliL protein
MAEDVEDDAAQAEDDGERAETGARWWHSPRIRVIAAAATLAVTVAGGGITYLFWAGNDDEASASATIDLGGPLVYHELPEFLADLQSEGRTTHHIKLQIVAELPEDHVALMVKREIGIVDAVLAYLRTQRRDDLTGEAGAEHLRSNLLAVINGEIAPAHAQTILFKRYLMD